jgi:hypothetical protein
VLLAAFKLCCHTSRTVLVRFGVYTNVAVKISVFREVTLCYLIDTNVYE